MEELKEALKDSFQIFGDPQSYRGLLMLLLMLPVGMITFTAALFFVTISLSLIFAPLIYSSTSFRIGSYMIQSLPEALVAAVFGVIIATASMYVFKWFSLISYRFMGIILGFQELDELPEELRSEL